MKILLLSQGSQGVQAIRELFSTGIIPADIMLAICNVEGSRPLIEFAEYHEILYFLCENQLDLDIWLRDLNLNSYHLVSIGWKYLIKPELYLRCVKAINLHPGLLPEYRGCFSTPWSIINGEEVCGFTYHFIDECFDTGKIIVRKEFAISEFDTSFNLNFKILNEALRILRSVIDDGCVEAAARQEAKAIYYRNELPYGGVIPLDTAEVKKERIARALFFPPHAPAYDEELGRYILPMQYLTDD